MPGKVAHIPLCAGLLADAGISPQSYGEKILECIYLLDHEFFPLSLDNISTLATDCNATQLYSKSCVSLCSSSRSRSSSDLLIQDPKPDDPIKKS